MHDGPKCAQVFGIDVESAKPGSTFTLDRDLFGFPNASLADVPAGELVAQAVLHRYETFHLHDGRVLELPMNRGEGQQWDIWEAVFTPVGKDGYPARIFDKRAGVIDGDVAEYWRANYDLRAILERDGSTLGPKLQGKIHIYCGTLDNYYLDNSVALMQEYLKSTENPHSDAVVDYGLRAEHCWIGDHERPNACSRLRNYPMYVDTILDRIAKSAPSDADRTSWRY